MAAENLKWWQKTIVYQIYPKSFADTTGSGTGDLNGITKHLDYLKNLGVGAIWLTPIYPSPMVDNGYDISDYMGIDPSYGTMADFEKLIAESDKRNIKIVMDLVYNHSSDKNSWFLESKSSKNNPKADWYIWRDGKPDGSAPTNWRSIFGGSAWTYCEERKQFYLHTFAPAQPDLNWENPEVRQALFDAANFWLDKGVGGFRIDAITYIKKPSEFKDGKPDGKDGMSGIHNLTANTAGILDFLHEFKQKVFIGHDIFTVGEANGVAPEDLNKWVGKDGVFDMVFEFSHMNLPLKNGEIWCRPTEWKLSELKKVLSDSQAATKNNGWCPVFFENHDQPRSVNHFFDKNADKIKAAKAMATILLTLRGTPFIYEGQELGCTNVAWNSIEQYNDISSHGQYDFAIKEGFTKEQAMEFVHFFSRDNARTPMQWNDSKNAGFSTGTPWLFVNENYKTVNAENEEKNPDSVLSWYKKLSKFRSENLELTAGDYKLLLPDDEKIFAFSRSLEKNSLITVVNFSTEPAELPKEFSNKKILIDSESQPEKNLLKPLEARILRN
ncbi:MAG: alpha-glucosidase [Selenomonadaceae bacterium]|nr:alpha-glucosidase [Selenomonadaceae bacterium]